MPTTLTDDEVSMLLEHAINDAWVANETPGSDGCCPTCCGPCSVVKRLLDAGELDAILAERLRGRSFWWNDDEDRGDWGFLHRYWRVTSCHDEN